MILKKVGSMVFIANGPATRVLARQGLSDSKPEEWPPIPVKLERIWRRLTFMSDPLPPWWHKVPFWHRLSFRITERLDHWFWHPPLQGEGRVEFFVYDQHHLRYLVSFKSTEGDRIELSHSAVANE
jgi:hypothetical protein